MQSVTKAKGSTRSNGLLKPRGGGECVLDNLTVG